MKNIKAIIFDAYGLFLMSIQLQKNVKIKSVVSGKVLLIIGELLSLNTRGLEA